MALDEPEAKKRKRNGESGNAFPGSGAVANDTQHARYPNLMLANKHNSKVHETIKSESVLLAELCVSRDFFLLTSDVTQFVIQDKVKLWVNLTMPKYAPF